MNYLTNWKFWLVLIIVVVFVIWLFLGGEDHEFIGLKALDPNSKSDQYVDPYEANYLKLNTNVEHSVDMWDNLNDFEEETDTCLAEIDNPTSPDFGDILTPSFNETKRPKFRPGGTSQSENPVHSVNALRTPSVFTPSFNNGLKTPISNTKFTPTQKSKTPRLFTPSLRTPLQLPQGGLRTPLQLPQGGPRTPLSTDPTKYMDVSVSLKEALADCSNEKKNKAESRGEAICRQVFEEIYSRKFPSTRPDFLKNPESGCNLELDGYCEELQIGFEYNGIQHYIYPNWAHRDNKAFEKQIRRDQYKIEACDLSGVYLISIPYTIPHNLIRDYIIFYLPENVQKRDEAKERGEPVAETFNDNLSHGGVVNV